MFIGSQHIQLNILKYLHNRNLLIIIIMHRAVTTLVCMDSQKMQVSNSQYGRINFMFPISTQLKVRLHIASIHKISSQNYYLMLFQMVHKQYLQYHRKCCMFFNSMVKELKY
jgi:hypothetical protein